MRACKPLPYGQLTTALVPTVPSPCFLRQSSTVAKVRETFCVSFVLICFVIGELLSEVGGRVGHGLVLAWFESYVTLSLFRQFFTIARTRETLCHLIYLFPRRSSRDTVVCIHLVEEIMADLARFSALFIIFCSSPGILREPPFFARERETFGYLFCTCTPYGS